MDLHKVEGDGGVCEADPQDRLVARRAAAQIAQPHLAAGNDDFLLQGLQHRQRQSTAGVSLEVMGREVTSKTLWTSGVQGAQEEVEGAEVRRRRENSRKKIRRDEERRNSSGLHGQFLHGVPALTNSPP